MTPTSTPLRRIAVLYHPKIEATRPAAYEIHERLVAEGLDAWLALTWDENEVRPGLAESDLAIVLGGDGSMLRTARMAAGHDVLLLGVNMGRLGFLTEVNPTDWQKKLPRVLAGDFWVERRMMLRAETWRRNRLLSEHFALNDVVISRGTLARVVRLCTKIDGEELATYVSDGLIVSTPTGSTAYALAVGGPILPPDLRSILVIPIAPHLTLSRAVVLPEGATVSVHVGTDHRAFLTGDGQFAFETEDGDRVEVRTSESDSYFVRLGERTYFYHMLLERLAPKLIPYEDDE